LQLLSHPNIVKIYDVVETNSHLNIAMEYLSGHSLGTYLKAQPKSKIAERACRAIFQPIAKALSYLHRLNIAHRDIKLENVIRDEELTPKLLDYGFSTCIEAGLHTQLFCGTPSYRSPEVVQRREYRGETADVWALGVLLFVALTGVFPFRGATDEELFRKIGEGDYSKNELSVSVSRAGRDLIARMLRIDVEERIKAQEVVAI
jgi:MAP/microtubule affinity-regulating kinase